MNATVGISGIGLVGPWGTDLSSLRAARSEGAGNVRLVETVPAINGVAKNDMRRMSKLTRFSLFAASRALAQSGRAADKTGLFVGLTHGSTSHMVEFHDYLFDYGPEMASPNSFSNGVTNAPLSSVSAALKMTCGGTTMLGYENNGCEVLSYCARAIADSYYDACLAGSSEEYSPVVHDAYKACGWFDAATPPHLPFPREEGAAGLGISEGSAFVVLERLSHFTDKNPLCLFTPVDPGEYRGGAGVVISGAGAGPQDSYERAALAAIAKAGGVKPALLFTRPLFGETFGLGAMLSALVACDIVANGAVYPAFPAHPSLAGSFETRMAGPASSALVIAAARNGQVSAGLFTRADNGAVPA
jgi:3-oxoacyl-[acyl-carrier-protein] synthase II